MKPRGIHIAKVSLRLGGMTPQQARRRAGSIAGEIAEAVARESSRMKRGKTEIGGLSVRLQPDGAGPGIAEQIRKQLARD
jgi:hypothetical protein